jgi:hypothetical protein
MMVAHAVPMPRLCFRSMSRQLELRFEEAPVEEPIWANAASKSDAMGVGD